MMLMWGEEDGEDRTISSWGGGCPAGPSPLLHIRRCQAGKQRCQASSAAEKSAGKFCSRGASGADVGMRRAAPVVCQTPVCQVISCSAMPTQMECKEMADGRAFCCRAQHTPVFRGVCVMLRPVGERLLLLGAVSHVTQLANVLSLDSKSM